MRVDIEVVAGPMKGKRFSFDEPDRFLFGRAEDARCSLPNDPYVSRHHFLLEIAPPTLSLHDLKSKNGTVVGDIRYGGTKPPGPGVRQAPGGRSDVALRDGDEVVVGDTRLRVAVVPDPAPAAGGAATLSRFAVGGPPATLSKFPGAPSAPSGAARCARCGADAAPDLQITGGAGPLGEVVCQPCRRREADDPMAFVRELLAAAGAARAAESGPELPGYDILGVLGEGGMGKVFKARDRRSGRLVAIKTILPRAALNPNAVETFQREADVTLQLKHPRIVEFVDGGCANGTFFLVLEFVEGMDLGKLWAKRGRRMSLAEAGPLMAQALEGLAYAHRATLSAEVIDRRTGKRVREEFRGAVHRDLKPQNILLERLPGDRYASKVADFGLAKVYGSAGMTDMTRPGQMCGTPIYWPREQITNYRHLKPPADVFSMGAVFVQLLTGRLVRPGLETLPASASFHDICSVIANERPDPVRKHAPDLPRAVADAIDRSLAERPEDRFADAGEMREAFLRAGVQAG